MIDFVVWFGLTIYQTANQTKLLEDNKFQTELNKTLIGFDRFSV